MASKLCSQPSPRRALPLPRPSKPLFGSPGSLCPGGHCAEKAKKLCSRVQKSLDAGKPIDLWAGTRAILVNVLTKYPLTIGGIVLASSGVWCSEAA